jgi:tRNA threonylcarbamoyl adenosine modification protein YeaZ
MALMLAIETATAACSVALLDGNDLVAERHEVVGRGHAERLVPMIAALPGNGRADSIIVDCGPGSFTGVRVGLAAARALGLGWGASLGGFSSLALIAAPARDEGTGTVAVAISGGHGEIFVQRFAFHPLRPLGELASLTPEAAAAFIQEAVVIGSGAAALIAARGWGEAREALPRAADVKLLPPALATLPPRPIYGRAPDAKPQP